MTVVILFAVGGFAAMHYAKLDWALPTAILAGMIVAQFVPLPARKDAKG